MEISAHDLTRTVLCKVDGCDQEAVARVGTYGKLCSRHKEERRAELLGREPSTPRARATEGTLEAAVRDLVAPARAVDRARAKADAARRPLAAAEVQLEQALAAWRDAIGALR